MSALKANRRPQLSVRLDRIQGDISGTDHVAVISLNTNWGAGLSNRKEIEALAFRQTAIDHEMDAEQQETIRRLAALQDDFELQRERQRSFELAKERNRSFLDSTERLYLTGRKAWLDVLNAVREFTTSEIACGDAAQQAWNNSQLLDLLRLGVREFLKHNTDTQGQSANIRTPINTSQGDVNAKH